MSQDTYYGAIVIFYKNALAENLYLLVKNAKTENVSFLSGAQEGTESLLECALREVEEELGLSSDAYTLSPTEVHQDFVFDERKKERAGSKGSYQVFVADATGTDDIKPTKELKEARWMTEKEVIESLSFDNLREVFRRVLHSGAIARQSKA